MTRLAEVKAERDRARARAERYWLALQDLVKGRGIVEFACARDDQRYDTAITVRYLDRADPLVILTVNGLTDVHRPHELRAGLDGEYSTYANTIRDLLMRAEQRTAAVRIGQIDTGT